MQEINEITCLDHVTATLVGHDFSVNMSQQYSMGFVGNLTGHPASPSCAPAVQQVHKCAYTSVSCSWSCLGSREVMKYYTNIMSITD